MVPLLILKDVYKRQIEGLFNYIDPDGAEAKRLLDEGYKQDDWGVTLVKYADHYPNSNLLPGVKEGNVPPRYYWPIQFETLSKSDVYKRQIYHGTCLHCSFGLCA